MKINFKTRKEARTYCRQWGIPPKDINHLKKGALPWEVSKKETVFHVGRKYRLVDVTGFTKVGQNTANVAQATQILKHLDGVVTIVSKQGDRLLIDKVVPEISFDILNPWEAQFFAEVALGKTKPKAKKPTEPKPIVQVVVAPDPSLDDELAGGVNLAPAVETKPATQERNSAYFVEGVSYTLIDEAGFLNSHYSNANLINYARENTNGLFVVDNVYRRGDADIGHDFVLFARERKFFREFGTGVAPEPESVSTLVVDVEKQRRDAEIDKAVAEVESAMAEHQRAIEGVQKAGRAVREAAQKLALLAQK